MKKICLISFSPIAKDARVLRQIKYLSERYYVTVFGYGPAPVNPKNKIGIEWHDITPARDPKRHNSGFRHVLDVLKIVLLSIIERIIPSLMEHRYWSNPHYERFLTEICSNKYDLLYANDWDTLPLAAHASQRLKVPFIADLHEYAPEEYPDWKRRLVYTRFATYIIGRYARQARGLITVTPQIGKRYQQRFRLNAIIVRNVPEAVSVPWHDTNPSQIQLIHHGVASRYRHPELMIEAMQWCDPRFELNFMFLSSPGDPCLAELKEKAAVIAPGRVHFHAPVPPAEIIRTISAYDIGLYNLPPLSYNDHVALPNKFFDFIAGGLAVCIGPSIEMAAIVQEYRLGVVAESFSAKDLARCLNQLTTEQIMTMRLASLEATKTLNAEIEFTKVFDLTEKIFNRSA